MKSNAQGELVTDAVGWAMLMFSIKMWQGRQNSLKEARGTPETASFVVSYLAIIGAAYMVSVLGQQQYPEAFHA